MSALALLAAALTAYLPPREPEREPVLITSPDWRVRAHAGSAGGAAAVSPHDEPVLTDVPGRDTRWADMVEDAVLDLGDLTSRTGSVVAGAADRWAYEWPRDSAFAAVAFARSGQPQEARRVLDALATLPFDDDGAGFEARYRPDTRRAPDDRPPQSDGAGWYLWALAQVTRAQARPALSSAQRDMLDRCTGLILRLTDDGRRLPPPSPDYWEVPVRRVSLGTVAPMATGLAGASRLYDDLGDAVAANRTREAHRRLAATVFRRFGGVWERFGHDGGLDAAVTFMMPPFALETRDVAQAWLRYQAVSTRRAGGLAPGEDWKRDGTSWTPETALVAYTAAASGRGDLAAYWLDWLDAHRTAWGSLPEKVTRSGRPAGPAPLAWTAALVVLTVAELESPTAPVPRL